MCRLSDALPPAATSRIDRRGSNPGSTSLVVAPLAFIVVVAFALCAAFGYLLARESDMRHQTQQRAALVTVLNEFRAVFADMTARRAVSPVWESGDAMEFARALEPMGVERYRHHEAFVLDATGAVLAAFPSDASLPPAIPRIIAALHADAAPSSDADGVVTDFAVLGDRPRLVSAAAIGSSTAGPRAGQPATVIRMAGLDRALSVFGAMSGISALAFDIDTPQGDRELHSLHDAQGRIVGWLSWQREYPMTDMLIRLGPFLTMLAACLICFAVLTIRQISRTTRRLAASEAQAHKIAYEDPVTVLPNRRKMLDLLDAALGARASDQVVSFGLIALDAYREMREASGEEAANTLVAAVAARLRAAIAPAATLGRMGEDEFAVIARDANGMDGFAAAKAALTEMEKPFWVASQAVQVNLTIGLVRAPADGETREELARRADLARQALHGGAQGRIGGFAREMEQQFRDRLFIKRELRRALTEEAFEVHYQPIVAAEGQRIVGVEALLRWDHPARGPIGPAEFIPVAEESGVMMELGAFVLRRALADAARWPDVYIAVNLSPVQMRDRGLVALVAATLAQTGIAPSRVVLEITEGVLIDDPDEAKERLDQLRGLGVKIALDDFGSGYSSLGYLRRFPIDKLKIDKQFVAPLGASADSGVIIQAIMALGRALGLTVLCEGVETEEQRILLRLAGCDEMQGFLFAKPAPRAVIDRMLMGAPERESARA